MTQNIGNWRRSRLVFKNKINFKYIILILVFIFVLSSNVYGEKVNDKKAVILMIDEMSMEDLLLSNTPNIDKLKENGGLGLMNTRAKSSISNKGSTYLSLGMGVRTLASTQGGYAFNYDELISLQDHGLVGEIPAFKAYELYNQKLKVRQDIINIAIADIKRTAYDVTPNNRVGLLGEIAKNNNLNIGFLGNKDLDKHYRESTLIAIDEEGLIPYGNIGTELLVEDSDILGGKRLELNKLIDETDKIIDNIDILFIDFGDISRIIKMDRLASDEVRNIQKLNSIERADFFLGELFKRLDRLDTLYMIISPNPSKDMIKKGNFGLTPIIVSSDKTKKGLLSSITTRREGLVTNFDFAPTLLEHFEIKDDNFIGDSITIVEANNIEENLIESQRQHIYIRKYRKFFHWIYIGLIILSLCFLYLPKLKNINSKYKDVFILMTTSYPISILTVNFLSYKNIFMDIGYVLLTSFLLAFVIYSLTKSKLKSLAYISILTSSIIILDSIFINKLMIISPFGSDAIAGGRFYGLGNDYMGILLSSSILGLFSFYEYFKLDKKTMLIITTLFLSIIILALSPFYGANMGGTLAAIFTMLLAVFIILDINISVKKLIILGVIVTILILGLASIDIIFNPNPTHAGKAIKALVNGGGISKLLEIIESKLRQVFWNIAKSYWNIVLFIELLLVIYIYVKRKNYIKKLVNSKKCICKGLALIGLSSIFIFIFNDTGTIAAAMALSNLLLPINFIKID